VDGRSGRSDPLRGRRDGAKRLRVLSYNIQVGISSSKYRHYVTHSWKHVLPFPGRLGNLDGIARFVDGFDMVGLQELDAGSLRSGYINQAEYLAHRAGFPAWYAQTNRNLGQFAKHSLGLLSRFPPVEVLGHRLPSRIPGRGALAARFGHGHDALLVVVVHLSLGSRARARQLAYIADLVSRHPHALVLGDFNCPLDSRELQTLLESTQLVAPERRLQTYPSWRPRQSLDHILVTPELDVLGAEVYDVGFSDHLPVAVEVALPAGVELRSGYETPAGSSAAR
jgi:endonuclease/exonuclease/phosphatase family metal-dependent hydrolase